MLYIVAGCSLNLLSYYVNNSCKREIEVIVNAKASDLQNLLLEPGEVCIDTGTCIEFVKIVEYIDKEPPSLLRQVEHNKVYLHLKSLYSSWLDVVATKSWVKRLNVRPDMVNQELLQVKSIFSSEAYDYFWQLCRTTFNSNPYKWKAEAEALLLYYQATGTRISLQYLQKEYSRVGNTSVSELINGIGKKHTTTAEYIFQMKSQELWTCFIARGNEPSILMTYAIEKKLKGLIYALAMLELGVQDGAIDIRIGCTIFGKMLSERDKDIWEQELNRESVRRFKCLFGLIG